MTAEEIKSLKDHPLMKKLLEHPLMEKYKDHPMIDKIINELPPVLLTGEAMLTGLAMFRLILTRTSSDFSLLFILGLIYLMSKFSTTSDDETLETTNAPYNSIHSPSMFRMLIIASFICSVLGFTPSFFVYFRTGKWYVNSVVPSIQWAKDSLAMKIHILIAFIIIGIFLIQFLDLGPELLQVTNKRRQLHSWIGNLLFMICIVLFLQGHILIFQDGVAGKIVNNGIVSGIGAFILLNGYMSIVTGQRKQRRLHVEHVILFVIWFIFPGLLRCFTLFYQIFILHHSCDVFNTSGIITCGCIFFFEPLHRAFRWAAFGSPFTEMTTNTKILRLLCLIDMTLGAIDHSFLICPTSPLLQQVPGKAFNLEQVTIEAMLRGIITLGIVGFSMYQYRSLLW